MEENRINRRSRPRPYDLRRKVLLKNFLREQMTFIPGTQLGSFPANDDNNNDNNEPEISLNLDEDLPELNDENVSSAASTEQQCPSVSSTSAESGPSLTEVKANVEENPKDSQPVIEDSSDSNRPSGLSKITSLMKLRSSSKKKQNGIVKAKDAINSVRSPTKSKPFKRGLERVFSRKKTYESSSQSTKPRSSSRSLFSLFKNRRAQRNADDKNRTKNSPYENQKSFDYRSNYTPSNRSTEDSWLRQALLKEQQSNRLLREENRILSESLSYFMSSSSMDSQNNHCNRSTLQSRDKHSHNNTYHDYYPPLSNASNDWNPSVRVVRSKSVQEHSDRKTMLRNNYRTRSMNCHNGRKKVLLPDPIKVLLPDPNKVLLPDPNKTLLPDPNKVLFPVRNKVLLPDHEPPTPMYSSQFEGYNPRLRRKTILANLPVDGASRGIQRRSSMPERILSENDRTLVCRRAGSFRDAYHRKPFHLLPSEAFY